MNAATTPYSQYVVIGLVTLFGTIGHAAEPSLARSLDVEIEYTVNRAAQPLASVELWYTADDGASWTEFGFDADRRSPASFRAPGDGDYGVYLVLTNATGPSSQPPTAGVVPHVHVLVDQTPPVVQLHALRLSTSFGQPVVQVRWSAIDALFSARPIELYYRGPIDADWQTITPEPIANTGRYDWSVPDGVSGVVNLKVVVRDRGGHVVPSAPQMIDLTSARAVVTPLKATQTRLASDAQGARFDTRSAGLLPSVSGSPRARTRASELIDDARRRRDRGDTRSAISRLRDAVRLDPSRTDAFAEMARLFYGLGEWDRSLSAYEIVLKQEPGQREALLGSAMAQTQRKDYAAAGARLRSVLRYDPKDAEAWMSLGDVAIYSGDEVLARDCYTRASRIDPSATRIVEDARRRLALMDDVSRRYGE